MATQRKRRIPKLSFTDNRGVGWHVSYRDPKSGTPRKHRFDLVDPSDKGEAERRYAQWLDDYLNGRPAPTRPKKSRSTINRGLSTHRTVTMRPGSLLEVANGLLNYEESRVREADAPRARGTIHPEVYRYRCYYVRAFLKHINEQHGRGAAGRVRVDDLTMQEVEAYNRRLADSGLSSATIAHSMQAVRHLIIRAGRPEHGQQVLSWNWESRDRFVGRAKRPRSLPTLDQLQRTLAATDLRGRAMIWTAIGLGFGPSDLAALRVGQIDEESYDLRRAKTGVERFGETPPLVWSYLNTHLETTRGQPGALVFHSETGLPLVDGHVNRVQGWWHNLREKIGESKDSMSGFYVLRHLGATEFGARSGCSISQMRAWLGHSASSAIADVYMRPIAPEHRSLVLWVRERLASSVLDK